MDSNSRKRRTIHFSCVYLLLLNLKKHTHTLLAHRWPHTFRFESCGSLLQLGRVLPISTRVPVAAVFPSPGHVTWMMTVGTAPMSLRPAVNDAPLCWCQLIKINKFGHWYACDTFRKTSSVQVLSVSALKETFDILWIYSLFLPYFVNLIQI